MGLADRKHIAEFFRSAGAGPVTGAIPHADEPDAVLCRQDIPKAIVEGPLLVPIRRRGVRRMDRAAGCQPFLPVEAEELPAVQLSPDAGTRLRVIAEGQTVPGAWVVASAVAVSRAGSWRPGLRMGRTAADGSLTLPRAEGERLQVSVFLPGRPEVVLRRTVIDEAVVREEGD